MMTPDEEFTEAERPSTRQRLDRLRDLPQHIETLQRQVNLQGYVLLAMLTALVVQFFFRACS